MKRLLFAFIMTFLITIVFTLPVNAQEPGLIYNFTDNSNGNNLQIYILPHIQAIPYTGSTHAFCFKSPDGFDTGMIDVRAKDSTRLLFIYYRSADIQFICFIFKGSGSCMAMCYDKSTHKSYRLKV